MRVDAYVNVEDLSMFNKLQPRDRIAYVGLFHFLADDALEAAERMFEIGNTGATDTELHEWPSDVRSMSVGDLVCVTDEVGRKTFLACESLGWRDIVEPSNRIVPLAGTIATSRV